MCTEMKTGKDTTVSILAINYYLEFYNTTVK